MTDLLTPSDQRHVIGKKVTHYREAKGWTQPQLADALNEVIGEKYWNHDKVHTLEKGKTRLPAEWLPTFAYVLEVSEDDLLSPVMDLRKTLKRPLAWLAYILADLRKLATA